MTCRAAAGLRRTCAVLRVVTGALALTLLAAAPRALADATPVQLVLAYMPNVSNTGPTSASGIAELVMPEGEVRLSAAGLPHLDDGASYVAWVVNSGTNEFQRLGAFNASESTGAVHFEDVLPDAIPNKQWNVLLVTVEHGGDARRPSDKHSIAGLFPSANTASPPAVLPNTGGAEPDTAPVSIRPDWLPMAGLATLTGAIGLGAGYTLGFKRR